MDRVTFLTTLKTAREGWDALLRQIEARQPVDGRLNDDWSVRDLIAHVTWYEREMVGMIAQRALVGSDWWDLPLDDRNARIAEAGRERSLAETCADALALAARLLAAAETLSDDDLRDASHFAEMPPEWLPWEVIASNTFEHYPDHIPDLQAWLDNQ